MHGSDNARCQCYERSCVQKTFRHFRMVRMADLRPPCLTVLVVRQLVRSANYRRPYAVVQLHAKCRWPPVEQGGSNDAKRRREERIGMERAESTRCLGGVDSRRRSQRCSAPGVPGRKSSSSFSPPQSADLAHRHCSTDPNSPTANPRRDCGCTSPTPRPTGMLWLRCEVVHEATQTSAD